MGGFRERGRICLTRETPFLTERKAEERSRKSSKMILYILAGRGQVQDS